MVQAPALSSQAHIDPRTPIPPLVLGNLPDPGPQHILLVASTAIRERIAIEGQEPTHPSLTEPKALGAPLSRRSLRLRPYQFFALMAFIA